MFSLKQHRYLSYLKQVLSICYVAIIKLKGGKRMVRSKKMVDVEDEEAKQLAAFVKNVEKADSVKEQYPRNFIAVCGQEIIAHDTEHKRLLDNITEYLSEKELYIGYLPGDNEVLLV